MTLEDLMNHAAAECIDERERYLIMFTGGSNAYVCRNEGLPDESHALFKGSYRDCQVWIERRGIAAALRFILQYQQDIPELTAPHLTPTDLLRQLFHTPQ